MSVQVVTDFRKLDELIRKVRGKPVRILHDGVEYGIYNEFGTTRMTPRPFIGPGLEGVRKAFWAGLRALDNLKDMERYVDKLGQDAAEIARQHILMPPPRVDTSAMLNSVKISTEREFGQ